MTCGIYKLTFPSGNFYIGKSVDIEKRWRQHWENFSKGKHTRAMQAEFERYGDYGQEILLECHEDHIDIVEETYIAWYSPPLNGTKGKDRLSRIEDMGHLPIFMEYFNMSTLEHVVELHNGKGRIAELIEILGNKESTLEERDDELDAYKLDLKEAEEEVERLEENLRKEKNLSDSFATNLTNKQKTVDNLRFLVSNLSLQRNAEEIEQDTLNRLAEKDVELLRARDCKEVLTKELEALNTECNELWKYKKLPWYKKIFA